VRERPGVRGAQFPQTPARQTFGLTQVVPQAPQLALSVWRFVQVPAQFVKGASQVHCPPLHWRLPPHVAPQNMQFVLLLERSAQIRARPFPQGVVGGTQEMTQAPSEHRGAEA